jgi:hypothetical protein
MFHARLLMPFPAVIINQNRAPRRDRIIIFGYSVAAAFRLICRHT